MFPRISFHPCVHTCIPYFYCVYENDTFKKQFNPDDVPDSTRRKTINNDDTFVIANVPLRKFQQVKSVMQPVFIDHENRQFLNPISYIGGPRLDSSGRLMNRSNRNSIDSITSILSID